MTYKKRRKEIHRRYIWNLKQGWRLRDHWDCLVNLVRTEAAAFIGRMTTGPIIFCTVFRRLLSFQ